MKIETVIGKLESNTFVVQDKNTTIVIEAGAPLEKLMGVLGGREPSAIFLTHEHFDHVYYLDDYKNQFGCPIYTPVTEEEIVVGDIIVVKPILCPGHSPQSVVYKIGEDLFTGDVLFSDTIGRTDLMPNGEVLMQKTLKKLLDVKFKVAYHGHYEPSSYEEQQENIRRFLD
ncbi:MAG: MBL fold metallo-hydrolase [Firmicutes bacterium]|nr:MBL fold metallo-hydrolase [Bacillota bacterium]